MSGQFSLRRRLVLSMLGVFVLGIAATAIFYRWELRDIQQRLRLAPANAAAVAIQLDQMVEEDVEFLAFILVPFSVAAIGVILLMTHWSLRGIRRASQHAEQIDAGRMDARLDTDGLPSEIIPLVRSVNGSLGRLSDACQAEQRLTANAAHELRTPLAVLQMRLQTAKLHGAMDWPLIEQDLGRLQRVITQLLGLARRDSEQRTNLAADRQVLNLARVLREAAAQVLPLAEDAGRTIEIEAPDQVLMEGAPDDLADMLRNLLDNSLQHGRGAIRATMRQASKGGVACVAIVVTDEGEGIPESLRDAAFERFRKLSSQSKGAGLGLAIVRQVAREHGGDAGFDSNAQGFVEVVLRVENLRRME